MTSPRLSKKDWKLPKVTLDGGGGVAARPSWREHRIRSSRNWMFEICFMGGRAATSNCYSLIHLTNAVYCQSSLLGIWWEMDSNCGKNRCVLLLRVCDLKGDNNYEGKRQRGKYCDRKCYGMSTLHSFTIYSSNSPSKITGPSQSLLININVHNQELIANLDQSLGQ